jgi:HD-like signal output (HDOD) protein
MGFFDTLKKTVAPRETAPSDATQKTSAVSSSKGSTTDRPSAPIKASAAPERTAKSCVLFVATAAEWHLKMEPELRRLHPQWECQITAGVAEAVKALQAGPFLAVVLSSTVADDPALAAVLQHEAGPSLRIVLCAANDRAALAKLSATGATPLSPTADAGTLAATIQRLARVQEWMSNAGMKKLLAQCRKLPAMPRLYSQVTAELNSPEGSLEVVARLIGQDPVMTAKILQVVNSAFFGLGREITEPYEAVLFLGAERTRSLLLLAGVFTQFEDLKSPACSAEQIWNHSLLVGTLARTIAVAEVKNVKLAEAAFTAGLIHDMGKLILMANVPAMCTAIEQLHTAKQLTQREAELQVLGTTHAKLAACLLGNWGLALPVLEAVAWHHCPTRSSDGDFTLLAAVHAANVFAYESGTGTGTAALPERFDHEYLLQIERGDRRNDWRKACGLPLRQEEDAEHARIRLRCEAKVN